MGREQSLARKHLKQALGLNPNFHLVYAAVAKDNLKQLVVLPFYGNKDRGADF